MLHTAATVLACAMWRTAIAEEQDGGWFFARGDDAVRVETRFDKSAREVILEITRPDKTVDTQRFGDRAAFQTHLQMIEAQLEAEAWVQRRSVAIGLASPFTN